MKIGVRGVLVHTLRWAALAILLSPPWQTRAAAMGSDPSPKPELLLPSGAEGWEMQGRDGIYGPENLFKHIDGAAEIYLAFNVRRVVSRLYGKRDGSDIIVDIFDMGTSNDAFGAYHFDMREGEGAGIGAESELVGSGLAFWKDRFFVSFTPFADNPAIRKAVLSLGRKIDGSIPEEGSAPDLAALLPREGLIRSQVHYFHDDRILRLLLSVKGKNPLRLSRKTEGIIARYRLKDYPGTRQVLVLVRYPDEGEARKALDAVEREIRSFRKRRDGGKGALHWSEARLRGDLLVSLLKDAEMKNVQSLVAEVLSLAAQREKEEE